jgi:transcriptional regulator with XRE-family HTH domain
LAILCGLYCIFWVILSESEFTYMSLLEKEEVGKRLKFFREWNYESLSINQFADQAGVDGSYYGRIEKGLVALSKSVLEKLSAYYKDLDRDYILFGYKSRLVNQLNLDDEQIQFAVKTFNAAESILEDISEIQDNLPADILLKQFKANNDRNQLVIKMLINSCQNFMKSIDSIKKIGQMSQIKDSE